MPDVAVAEMAFRSTLSEHYYDYFGDGLPTMIWRDVDMSKISNSCCAAIDHFKAATELAPENIFGVECKCCKIAGW